MSYLIITNSETLNACSWLVRLDKTRILTGDRGTWRDFI
jgi:hypothetical protein